MLRVVVTAQKAIQVNLNLGTNALKNRIMPAVGINAAEVHE
jgi:hypothetical protein